MGRIKKDLKRMPTIKLRAKAFFHIAKFALCNHISGSGATLMDRMFKAALDTLARESTSSVNTAKHLRQRMGFEEGSFVSSGRWKDWYDGAMPTPQKIEVIRFVLPQIDKWFESVNDLDTCDTEINYGFLLRHKSQEKALHPILGVFRALDLYSAEEVVEENVFSFLIGLSQRWRPTLPKDNHSGWICSIFPDHDLSPDIVLDSYSLLDLSSILRFMLVLGVFVNIQDRASFKKWIFDLIAISVCIKAIIKSKDFADESVNPLQNASLGGVSLEIASIVVRLFILKADISTDSLLNQKLRLSISIEDISQRINPSINDFEERLENVLLAALNIYQSELASFGIDSNDLKKVYRK